MQEKKKKQLKTKKECVKERKKERKKIKEKRRGRGVACFLKTSALPTCAMSETRKSDPR